MKKSLATLLISCLFAGTLTVSEAMAHGNTEPQFGGVVKIVGEYSFELKQMSDNVSVWVFYDGEPLNASDLALTLKVKGEGKKDSLALTAADGNEFTGKVKIDSGDTAQALLTLEDGYSKIVAKYKF